MFKNNPFIALLVSIFVFLIFDNSISGIKINTRNLKSDYVVAKDSSEDFTSIAEALANIPINNSSQSIVFVKNGVYEEKILIDKDSVLLIGESRKDTKIIFAEQKWVWQCKNDPTDPLPAVVNVTGNVCTIMNLTIYNNYGDLYEDEPLPKLNCDIENYQRRVKPHGHQYAFKLSKSATRLIIRYCDIMAAGADTFCPWNKESGMYYVSDTHFEGYTDFVCPRGDCYITDSEFYSRGGSVTLWHDGSASKGKKFVINNSRFDGVQGFKLGRYTHDAQIVLMNCMFSKNMADQNIYQAKPDVQWGHRIYYYNCSKNGSDYSWYKDNFTNTDYLPAPEFVTPLWTFNGNWDPEKYVKEIMNKILK